MDLALEMALELALELAKIFYYKVKIMGFVEEDIRDTDEYHNIMQSRIDCLFEDGKGNSDDMYDFFVDHWSSTTECCDLIKFIHWVNTDKLECSEEYSMHVSDKIREFQSAIIESAKELFNDSVIAEIKQNKIDSKLESEILDYEIHKEG